MVKKGDFLDNNNADYCGDADSMLLYNQRAVHAAGDNTAVRNFGLHRWKRHKTSIRIPN